MKKPLAERDIAEEIVAKVLELGVPASAEFFKSETKEIEKWLKNSKKPPLEAAVIFLAAEQDQENPFGLTPESDPSAEQMAKAMLPQGDDAVFAGQTIELYERLRPRVRMEGDHNLNKAIQSVLDGKWTRNMVMLFPSHRDINPHVMFAVCALLKRIPWMGFQYKANTIIQRARNLLAHDFLKSEAEWSFWLDSDVVPPFNDPGFFYHKLKATNIPDTFLKVTAPERLLSHNKKLVGAVYARRGVGDGLCAQPQLHPRHSADKGLVEKLKRGPFNELYEVDYVATGCTLIHRDVYEDIKKANPQLGPKDEEGIWDFFGHDTNKEGEDIHFCKLAKAAGHQSYLDCGLFCGHVGNFCFFP